jgi:hypothetical protein
MVNEQLMGFSLYFAASAEEYADVEYAKRQTGYTRQDFFNYKLVDLIVQDCITTVQKRFMGDNNREDMEVLRCVSELKNRFGVEE